jgi:hypothetical protein
MEGDKDDPRNCPKCGHFQGPLHEYDCPAVDPALRPMTVEQAEAELASLGNVMPMTDAEIESSVDCVMKMIRAEDN